MTCQICGQAAPEPGTATVTIERGDSVIVLRRVPALVCPNCGEEYVGEEIAAHVETLVSGLVARPGITVDVRDYSD